MVVSSIEYLVEIWSVKFFVFGEIIPLLGDQNTFTLLIFKIYEKDSL